MVLLLLNEQRCVVVLFVFLPPTDHVVKRWNVIASTVDCLYLYAGRDVIAADKTHLPKKNDDVAFLKIP